jgi:hypothetical protein
MRKKMNYKFLKIKNSIWIVLLILISFSLAFTFKEGEGGKKINKVTLKAGDSYYMAINNIAMPMNKEGVLADVTIQGRQPGGRLTENQGNFLFSGGFYLSGVTNGTMWSNAVASASRIQDYQPGTYESGRSDSRAQLYVLKASDGDFAQSWEDWRDAVDLGAYYHDGDGDDSYNPSDLNGNGKWDPTEDRPDLIGDETIWCVYSDQIDPALRRFNDVDPQGIEIRQSVFGFTGKGVTGNMIFVRYSILNTGVVADVIDDVYFSVWADPDVGEVNDALYDNLVGCDPHTNSGYTYNNGPSLDPAFGVNPPCFMIDFFQGPVSYVPGETFIDANANGLYDVGETTLDTAYNVLGQARGIAVLPGAKNVGLSSFSQYFQSSPLELSDPNTRTEARNYILGVDKFGNALDPCTFTFGNVLGGVNCAEVDNRYWYSGDPVTQTGWIQNFPNDQRQMSNTGPFKLIKDQPVDIVAAYVIGRGSDHLNSITVTREYDVTAQLLFDSNFPTLPAPPPIVYETKTGNGFIDITWETSEQVNYIGVDTVLDITRKLEGFYLTAFRTNAKAGLVAGVDNSELLSEYDLDNFISDIYRVAGNGGQDLIWEEATQLDTILFGDPLAGRIRYRIETDPFTGGPLIKGHEYYFAITHFYLNHNVIVNREFYNEEDSLVYGPQFPGEYYDPVGIAVEEFETPLIRIEYHSDLYSPASKGDNAEMISGSSDGEVKYLVVYPDQLTGENYQVDFIQDESRQPTDTTTYEPFWKLTNVTTGEVLIDSSKIYNFDTTSFAGRVTEGMILKVKPLIPAYESDYFNFLPEGTDPWYQRPTTAQGEGVFYVGYDLPQKGSVPFFPGNARSTVISADRLRRVEIRFGPEGVGKAYRYLNGFLGNNPIIRQNSYAYASGVTAADTVGKGTVGKLGEGFVDVPFTAWVVDEKYNEEYQLAAGFVERRSQAGTDFLGLPDGRWNPDTAINKTREIIVVFDSPYDPTGSQVEYTGGVFGTETIWADITKGYTIPLSATVTERQREIAKSPFFNTMYVVGLTKPVENPGTEPTGTFYIPLTTYPYTQTDQFTFQTKLKGQLSESDKRSLFEKINVFPNPLFGFNPATSYSNSPPDEPFITFSNLPPEEVTVSIYTLSGTLIRTLTTADKSSLSSPFLQWNLKNEDGLRAASGLYLAIVDVKGYGEKILKFTIVMPQKQINRF